MLLQYLKVVFNQDNIVRVITGISSKMCLTMLNIVVFFPKTYKRQGYIFCKILCQAPHGPAPLVGDMRPLELMDRKKALMPPEELEWF